MQIVGYREPAGLDRKPENATLRMSAHAIVQEFINLNEQLYGLVTNGRVLRLLRNSSRLIKLSYLEFDLDRIFTDGRVLVIARVKLGYESASGQDMAGRGNSVRPAPQAATAKSRRPQEQFT